MVPNITSCHGPFPLQVQQFTFSPLNSAGGEDWQAPRAGPGHRLHHDQPGKSLTEILFNLIN